MSQCPNCQAEYTPDPEQRFCDECGTSLVQENVAAGTDTQTGLPSGPTQESMTPMAPTQNPLSEPAPTPAPEAPAAAPAGVKNVVVGEGNISGQNVSIRHEVTVEYCAAGAEQIIPGSPKFMCQECHRSPVCDRHFDAKQKICDICVERQSVACSLCGQQVPTDQTFTCKKCRRVAGTDHLDATRDLCSDCSAQWSGVVESMEKDEVVITTDGTVAGKEDVELVDGVLKTKEGDAVATIKENVWYAKPKQWYRIKPKMLRREQQAMGRFYESMKLANTSLGDLYWLGPVTTWQGNEYQVRLQYPGSFPYRPPKAYVMEPKIEKSRHIYEDGHLCLFHRDDKTWEPGTTAATVMSWVSLWLHCYEAWEETGIWPRREHDEVVIETTY